LLVVNYWLDKAWPRFIVANFTTRIPRQANFPAT